MLLILVAFGMVSPQLSLFFLMVSFISTLEEDSRWETVYIHWAISVLLMIFLHLLSLKILGVFNTFCPYATSLITDNAYLLR